MRRIILAGMSAVMMSITLFTATAMATMLSHDVDVTHVEDFGSGVGLAPMFAQMDIVDTLKTDTIKTALADTNTMADVPILAGMPVGPITNHFDTATTGHYDTGDGATGFTYWRTSEIGWPAFGYVPAFVPVV
jgi:hypothetical protein